MTTKQFFTFLFLAFTLSTSVACDKENNEMTNLNCHDITIFDHQQDTGDDYDFDSATIQVNCLEAIVRFSGGCQPHDFELRWNETIGRSLIPTLIFALWHNANDDQCEAYLTDTLTFDLSTLKQLSEEKLNILLLNYDGEPLVLDF